MYRTLLATLALLPLIAGRAAAQPKFDPPKTYPPDAATLRQIEAKTAELRKAVGALPKDTPEDVVADVEVYAKAAEWIVRHGEWFAKDSGKQTLTVLDSGLERAKAAAQGKTPWRDVRGKPVIRGYRSRVDGSVQPFAVTLPADYPGGKLWRMDVVLHGRDQTLTEVKFIHAREAAKPAKAPDRIALEVYGRGNNAYRWAAETDVFEVQGAFYLGGGFDGVGGRIDNRRVVLRGFSMGGAGTWHIGLHRPFDFAAVQPGAGFTSTRGYVRNLPEQLPGYVERCLHIYDAVDYAENAFDVPVVAYSGEKDPQKAAADNIERALREFKEPVRFTHVVAPGLEHRQPPEWFAKCDAEIAKHLPRTDPDRVRLVTYTPRYGHAGWCSVRALERQYEKAVVDGTWGAEGPSVTTTNVRAVYVTRLKVGGQFGGADGERTASALTIDSRRIKWPSEDGEASGGTLLVKEDGRWRSLVGRQSSDWLHARPRKWAGHQGPIDDAFMDTFAVVPPTGDGRHPAVTRYAAAALARFGGEWDKYFRGTLPTRSAADVLRELAAAGRGETLYPRDSLVLFGDPGSNPVIARLVERLPITWTKDKLVVNGVEYDPKTHVPVLIYPNPLNPFKYVVINSGHTFHEADLKGTNALLYPRLGDWAVLKPTPTEKDAAAAEVVAAGLFDEFWQFPK